MVKECLDASLSQIQSSGERFRLKGYQFLSNVEVREIDRRLSQELQPVVGRRYQAI
jgi:hypothetical protein